MAGFVGNKQMRFGQNNNPDSILGLPQTAAASIPTAASGNEGCVVYDSTNNLVKFSDGSSWTALASTATTNTADAVYNAAAWTVAVDANDVIWNLATGYNILINAKDSGTTACALEINDNTTGTFTDGLLFTVANACTDAIDASAANITNAINVGANTIKGTTAVIDFTNFDVDADGNTTVNNLTVNGTYTQATITATTAINAGSNGSGCDVTLYTTTSGDKILWDASEKVLLTTDAHIQLGDNDNIDFGDGSATGTGDFRMYSDGTHLYIAANADVAGQTLYLGNDTSDIDVIWEGDTNNAIFQMDASTNQVELNGCDLRLQDNDLLWFGDGSSDSGDYKIYSDGTDIFIAAAGDNADAALKIGDATNDVDVIIYGDTSGSTAKFDSSAGTLILTTAGAAETAFTVAGAGTGAHIASITGSGNLTDNFAVCSVSSSAALASGGDVLRVSQATGTPNAASVLLELSTTGDMLGILASTATATGDAYSFATSGNVANTKAVLTADASGTPAATAAIIEARFTGTHTNKPTLFYGNASAKNCSPILTTAATDGTNTFDYKATCNTDAATGVSFKTVQNRATPATNDIPFIWTFAGLDASKNAQTYGTFSINAMNATHAQEDGRYKFTCAMDNGTDTQALLIGPRAGGALAELTVGTSAGNAYVTTSGAYSLILDTNQGSSTGNITIASGTNSDITLTPGGTGDVICAGDTLVVGDAGAAATLTTNGAGNLTINTNSGTNSGAIVINQGANGDVTLTANGSGTVIVNDAAIVYKQREVTAGTTTDTPDSNDGLVEYSTDGASNCAVTLPEAASNLGLVLTFAMATDGGKDVVITRAGADVIDTQGDTGNTTITLAEAGDMIQIMACLDNNWLVIANCGAALA